MSGEGSRGGLRGIHILEAPTFFLNRGPAWSKSGRVRVLWSSANCRPTFPPTRTRCSCLLIVAPRHSSVSSNPQQPCLFSKLNRICNVPPFTTLRRLTPWRCPSLLLSAGRPTIRRYLVAAGPTAANLALGLLPDKRTDGRTDNSSIDPARQRTVPIAIEFT